jgi:hypothetical protein
VVPEGEAEVQVGAAVRVVLLDDFGLGFAEPGFTAE